MQTQSHTITYDTVAADRQSRVDVGGRSEPFRSIAKTKREQRSYRRSTRLAERAAKGIVVDHGRVRDPNLYHRGAHMRSNILAFRHRLTRKEADAAIKRYIAASPVLPDLVNPLAELSERDVWLNEKANVADLRREAKRLGLTGYSKMKRRDLLDAIDVAEDDR